MKTPKEIISWCECMLERKPNAEDANYFRSIIQSLQTEPYFWEKCPYYVPDIMFDGEEEYDYGQCKYKESHYQIKDELIRKYDALFVLDGDEKGQECIRQLPPVNQQIIRCKDCKHRDPEDKKCDCGCWHFPFVTKDDDFCSYAEAKLEEGEY